MSWEAIVTAVVSASGTVLAAWVARETRRVHREVASPNGTRLGVLVAEAHARIGELDERLEAHLRDHHSFERRLRRP